MNEIETLLGMDAKQGILFIAVLVVAAVFLIQKWDWIIARFGVITKKQLHEEQQTKDIEELKKHALKTDSNIDKILNNVCGLPKTVDKISDQVASMREENNEAERSKLKDRINQSYRYYNQKGEWNRMEREAFNNF